MYNNVNHVILTVWEVNTGRCLKTVPCCDVIRSVAWRPNQAMSLIAVAADKKVLLINVCVYLRMCVCVWMYTNINLYSQEN